MKAKALTVTALCALAIALSVPTAGLAGAPTVTPFHGSEPGSLSICGLDLKTTFDFTGVIVMKTSGASVNAGEFTSVWTNPASGKSIMIHGSEQFMNGAPIDNGDGTISFIGAANGAYIVKDTHGAPITIDAGRFTARVTLDAATGQLVSVERLSVAGNESDTPADSSCDTIVAALT
jgi:hypothetical protein